MTQFQTSDGYTDAATIGPVPALKAVQFTIEKNPVFVQVARNQKGSKVPVWNVVEQQLAQGYQGVWEVQGIRFRSAVSQAPAQVTPTVFFEGEEIPAGSAIGETKPPNFLNAGITTAAAGVSQEVYPAQSIPTSAAIAIKALPTNTGLVYIGAQGVSYPTVPGYALSPGDAIAFDISNADQPYMSPQVTGEGVCWLFIYD